MQSLSTVKIGDSFEFNYALPVDIGSVVSSISCNVMSGTTLVQSLTITALGSDGINYNWMCTATAEQTLLWPTKLLTSDIKHVFIDGKIGRSDTFKIPVTKYETA